MKLEEKKKIEKILIKIASLHNPEVPPDLIKKHVAQHIDILDKHIDKYGVITHDSIKDLRKALSRLPRLKPPMRSVIPLSDYEKFKRDLQVLLSKDIEPMGLLGIKFKDVFPGYKLISALVSPFPEDELKKMIHGYTKVEFKYVAESGYEVEGASSELVPSTKSALRDSMLSMDQNYLNILTPIDTMRDQYHG